MLFGFFFEACEYLCSDPGQREVPRLSVVRVLKPIVLCLRLPTPLLLAFALYPASTQGAAAVVFGVSVCYFEILKR